MKKTEGKKEETPEMIHLLQPSAQEERPIGASCDAILTRDHGEPIGENRKDKPKSTADEEDSEGGQEETPERIHLLPPNAQ